MGGALEAAAINAARLIECQVKFDELKKAVNSQIQQK